MVKVWASFSISGETRLIPVEGHASAANGQEPTPYSSSHCDSQREEKTRGRQMIEHLWDHLEDMLAEGAIPNPHEMWLLLRYTTPITNDVSCYIQ